MCSCSRIQVDFASLANVPMCSCSRIQVCACDYLRCGRRLERGRRVAVCAEFAFIGGTWYVVRLRSRFVSFRFRFPSFASTYSILVRSRSPSSLLLLRPRIYLSSSFPPSSHPHTDAFSLSIRAAHAHVQTLKRRRNEPHWRDAGIARASAFVQRIRLAHGGNSVLGTSWQVRRALYTPASISQPTPSSALTDSRLSRVRSFVA